ncbi:MAG: transcriptional regulator [Clostridiales bacterium]|jgi:putative transcriptional regulator|nr:transcriptional regulator [Clostridiales bacterium]
MNVSESIRKGLEEASEYAKGNLKLRVTRVHVAEVKAFNADDIKELRARLHVGQKILAGILGVSPKTVEAWESGKNIPNGPSSRLIELLNTDPSILQKAGLYGHVNTSA